MGALSSIACLRMCSPPACNLCPARKAIPAKDLRLSGAAHRRLIENPAWGARKKKSLYPYE